MSEIVDVPSNVLAVILLKNGLQVILLLFCGWPCPVPDTSEKLNNK